VLNEVSVGENALLEGEEKLNEEKCDLEQDKEVEQSVSQAKNVEQMETDTPRVFKHPHLIETKTHPLGNHKGEESDEDPAV